MSDRTPLSDGPVETFTADERARLEPYFTNVDQPVFALINLPEVVKGALFARYSRSAKSLRRLFLDEFDEDVRGAWPTTVDTRRADKLYDRVFLEYGDDSVAQLGGVHLACENVSNVLTKVLEWGRLAAYLEQSTRYVPYTDQPGGRYKYHVPDELEGALRERYVTALDLAFSTYCDLLDPMIAYWEERHPREEGVAAGAYKRTIRAKALDTLRGLLPAATTANVGIYATGQAYEAMLLRMRANPTAEAQQTAALMLNELRKVIPAFLTRVDRDDRGVVWSNYLSDNRDAMARVADELLGDVQPDDAPEVSLVDFDPEGETKVVAAALYASSRHPDAQLDEVARRLTADQRAEVLRAYVGERANRRHRPGRAFERTTYRFDVLTDYGAFRDLQRHRMLTLEWQALSPRHGYVRPQAIDDAGFADRFDRALEASADCWESLHDAGLRSAAPYAVCMAFRVRFYMEMNAREAMHTIELRTAPAGHPAYRRVCQEMHRLIRDRAGHRALADAMSYVDHSEVELERLQSEMALERKREAASES